MRKQPHGGEGGPQHGTRRPPCEWQPCDNMPHVVWRARHLVPEVACVGPVGRVVSTWRGRILTPPYRPVASTQASCRVNSPLRVLTADTPSGYRIITTAATALLLVFGSVAAAQGQQGQGRVTGRVLDQTGAVLPGVTIDLVAGTTELTTSTNEEGRYDFDRVPAGAGELTFRLLNFSVLRRPVNVTLEAAMVSDSVLSLALNADVIVTGSRTFRNLVDVERPAENLVGIAAAASQGAVTAAQLEVRPLRRPGEVL